MKSNFKSRLLLFFFFGLVVIVFRQLLWSRKPSLPLKNQPYTNGGRKGGSKESLKVLQRKLLDGGGGGGEKQENTYGAHLLEVVEDFRLDREDRLAALNGAPEEIPLKIFTWWNSETLPPLVEKCIATWKRHNPTYNITILRPSILNQQVLYAKTPPNFYSLNAKYQADWVRLAVLMEEGGFWLDASMIMTQSLAWVHRRQQEDKSDGVLFFMDYFTSDPAFPYFENWFISAVPQAPFISAWFLEYSYCVYYFGCDDQYLDYLANMNSEKLYLKYVQASDAPGYLKQHLSLQKVLRSNPVSFPSAISALSEPFGPYSLMDSPEVNWNSFFLIDYLVFKSWPDLKKPAPPLIKLRSFERDVLGLQTTQGWEWVLNYNFWNVPMKRFYAVHKHSFWCIWILGLEDGCK